jgi:1-acyl-sn-glycerol-3-phosphate acyltransferase
MTSMLDIPRIKRIRLSRYPFAQRATGMLLLLNYRLLPGIKTTCEHEERLPSGPVIFAMNHTDRYNYFPFQVHLWRNQNRFTATWVKGKYYETGFVGGFMEKTNQLPTVSRGYLITKDFQAATGRTPTSEEYAAARSWVDASATGEGESARPAPDALPEALLTKPRDVLGHAFEPEKEDWASYLNAIFRIMMRHFVELNDEAARIALDLLIFPQGTRSTRLLPGHIGISQIALHLKLPIVPVGCNGSDRAYPGASPWAKRADIVYRIGEPIPYDALADYHVHESFEPFSPDAEQRHREKFKGLAALVTDRIDDLLDERYKLAPQAGQAETEGTGRFI